MTFSLKHPEATYCPRLKQFLINLRSVRKLPPHNMHLWKVMDTPAFEDTETALNNVLLTQNQTKKVSQK